MTLRYLTDIYKGRTGPTVSQIKDNVNWGCILTLVSERGKPWCLAFETPLMAQSWTHALVKYIASRNRLRARG